MTLNHKLQLGILLGASGISAAAGTTSVAISDGRIGEIVTQAISPVTSFIKDHVSSKLVTLYGGAKKISSIFIGWSSDIMKNDISKWIKSKKFDDISKGFKNLSSKFSSWYDSLKSKAVSLPSALKTIYESISMELIAKTLMNISESMEAIKSFISLMSSYSFQLIQSLITPSSDKSKDDPNAAAIEGIKKAFKEGKLMQFFDSLITVVKDNGSNVKKLDKSQVTSLFNFATKNVEKFITKVESLKKSNDGNVKGQWGNYNNQHEFINAIMDNSWSAIGSRLFAMGISLFTKCREGKTCDDDNSFAEFVDLLKSLAPSKKK